ncbi:MAG: ABC transporter permease subunit [Chloroflexota bacterium]|jgi:general L-amino acid transport system permease protein|nr:ABC transporter permease subunit [Chloroflexota bacterium]
MTAEAPPHTHGAVPFWRDIRVLRLVAQVAVVLVVAAVLAWMANNMLSAMNERGLGFGFSFLGRQAGFGISESPIPYSPADTYLTAFLVGLGNTLIVSVLGIILATILGVIVGVARLSPNWLVNRVAAGYVEFFRNTPLLVQLLLLYFAVFLQLPAIANSFAIGDVAFLNQRGVYLPAPQASSGALIWIGFIVAGIVLALAARAVARRREDRGMPSYRLRTIGTLGILVLAVAGWFVAGGEPVTFDVPVRERFNFVGGLRMSPQFAALLLGLVLYTAAFIGEVVRGGIQAVRRGQLEASRALGFSEMQCLQLVIFPQALRIIVPPLTSQYLNLTKNSSLAIAIGYPDLFRIGQTMANQTGQPVPVMILIMGTYLAISLVTSLLMNIYNRHVQVAER